MPKRGSNTVEKFFVKLRKLSQQLDPHHPMWPRRCTPVPANRRPPVPPRRVSTAPPRPSSTSSWASYGSLHPSIRLPSSLAVDSSSDELFICDEESSLSVPPWTRATTSAGEPQPEAKVSKPLPPTAAPAAPAADHTPPAPPVSPSTNSVKRTPSPHASQTKTKSPDRVAAIDFLSPITQADTIQNVTCGPFMVFPLESTTDPYLRDRTDSPIPCTQPDLTRQTVPFDPNAFDPNVEPEWITLPAPVVPFYTLDPITGPELFSSTISADHSDLTTSSSHPSFAPQYEPAVLYSPIPCTQPISATRLASPDSSIPCTEPIFDMFMAQVKPAESPTPITKADTQPTMAIPTAPLPSYAPPSPPRLTNYDLEPDMEDNKAAQRVTTAPISVPTEANSQRPEPEEDQCGGCKIM